MIRVNGDIIPDAAIQFELRRLVRFYAAHMSSEEVRDQMPLLHEKARDQAIGAKLLLTEAERLDLPVTDEDIARRLRGLIDEAGGEEELGRKLMAQGATIDALKASLARGCRVDKLIEKATQGAPEPTEAEIEQHFEEHAAEYRRPDRAQARHILIQADPNDEAAKATARSRLEEIRERIVEGGDFGEQAAAHSECPSGRRHGGSLGWFSRGAMVREFDDAVFSMEVGALSRVVESPLGFHLIEKLGEEPGGPASLDDARENIRDFLRHARRGEALTAFVEELKEKATIEDAP